jgi:hypothetical protein
MFDLWLSWLEDLNGEIDIEAKIDKLSKKKRELKYEICHLQYQTGYLYSLYSQANLALSKARYSYEKTDYELAVVDGRLTVCEEIQLEQHKNNNIKEIVSMLSHEERARLINELGALED